MARRTPANASLPLLALLIGCAPALEPGAWDGAQQAAIGSDGGVTEVSANFTHTIHADRVIVTVVDATDSESWQYLDLDSRRAEPASEQWDVGFSRFHVRTNGGASGPGGVQVAALAGVDFETLVEAPREGFAVDRPDGDEDGDSEPDNAFNSGAEDWYVYDVMAHVLTPREISYVVASTAGRFYKLRFESYYDAVGTPGVLTFRWAEIAASESDGPMKVDDAHGPPGAEN
jgi:hypothetical protein